MKIQLLNKLDMLLNREESIYSCICMQSNGHYRRLDCSPTPRWAWFSDYDVSYQNHEFQHSTNTIRTFFCFLFFCFLPICVGINYKGYYSDIYVPGRKAKLQSSRFREKECSL